MNPYRIWAKKLETATKEFQHRTISDDVYRACLKSAGFKGVRLLEEFNYQYGLRRDIEKHRTLNGRIESNSPEA